MNCHQNKDEQVKGENDKQQHSHKKHMILMILCCAIPIVLLLALPLLNLPEGRFSNLITFGIFLLCPLLHLVMMRGMMQLGKSKEKKREAISEGRNN